MRGSVWHLGLLTLVVVNLVAALQAVGSLMAVGLMMLPAIAARHFSRSVGGMVLVAVGIALVATVLGLLGSYHLDLPSGPAIVLVASGIWMVALVLGPVDGLYRPRKHLEG